MSTATESTEQKVQALLEKGDDDAFHQLPTHPQPQKHRRPDLHHIHPPVEEQPHEVLHPHLRPQKAHCAQPHDPRNRPRGPHDWDVEGAGREQRPYETVKQRSAEIGAEVHR